MRNGRLLLYLLTLIYQSAWSQSDSGPEQWHQVAIPQDGLYRLDRTFLEQQGILSSGDSLSQVTVYATRGGALPQSNAQPDRGQPVALSTYITENAVLFYAEGPDRRYYDEERRVFRIEQNPYDTVNYCYLTLGTSEARLPPTRPSAVSGRSTLITERLAVYHHEESQHNLLGSGRAWWGEAAEANESFSEVRFPVQSATSATLEVAAMSRSTVASRFTMMANGAAIGELPVRAAQGNEYGFRGRAAHDFFALDTIRQPPQISVRYESSTAHTGYLDYLTLNAKEPLVYRQSPLRFSDPAAQRGTLHQYEIQEARDRLLLWDISDPLVVQPQAFQQSDDALTFRVYADTLREFLLFDPVTAGAVPRYVGKVDRYHLRDIDVPELLIISPEAWREEAERLANFRRQHDGLSATVVTLPQVFQSFSGGRQDVSALRNFVITLYRRDQRLRYLLLLGDASYNYRSDDNHVPTYQSRESLHSVHSYASDDYYGFLEEHEGEWPERGNEVNEHDLEIGIGRLPVRTTEEARVVVDKLIRYATESSGRWRQRMLFVADDGDANKHQHQSDFLASFVEREQPAFHVQRLFMDSYPQEDNRAPEVQRRLNQAVARGTFLVDFIGHGGETAWTNEQILDLDMIQNWKNQKQLPIFLTATCEFGRYDDPQRASGAEEALLHPEGGAIALFTTSRPVFINTNFRVSTAFYEAAFGRDREQPLSTRRLGDLMRMTKNQSQAGIFNRNFILLGDPSMPLHPARSSVELDAIQVDGIVRDTLHPLELVTLRGTIKTSGEVDSTFQGVVYLDWWAPPQSITTLGEEDTTQRMTYHNREHRLHHGLTRVKNGRFATRVRLPRNAPTDYTDCKLTMYAVADADQREAAGAYNRIVVGGSPIEHQPDQHPPNITLFFNQETQPVPTTLYPHPTLIVKLYDESGINLADETHGLRLTVDSWQSFVLNDAFEATADTLYSGQLSFRLPELVSGNHTLRMEASDAYLNRGERTLNFSIVSDSTLLLQDFTVYPNPTDGVVNLSFRVGESVRARSAAIQIYNTTGEAIAQREVALNPGQVTHQLADMLSLTSLPPGTYLYAVTVADETGHQQTQRGKLLVNYSVRQ